MSEVKFVVEGSWVVKTGYTSDSTKIIFGKRATEADAKQLGYNNVSELCFNARLEVGSGITPIVVGEPHERNFPVCDIVIELYVDGKWETVTMCNESTTVKLSVESDEQVYCEAHISSKKVRLEVCFCEFD